MTGGDKLRKLNNRMRRSVRTTRFCRSNARCVADYSSGKILVQLTYQALAAGL